jgi:tape measure domain-containing protein
MAGALEWTAKLNDGWSGPGNTIADTLARMTAGVEKYNRAEAALKNSVGRDAIAKLKARHAEEEKGARSDLMANMTRYDGMRDAAALAKTKTQADAATQAMNRYAAAVQRANDAWANRRTAGRETMGKTGANDPGGIFGRAQAAQSALARLTQAAGNMFGARGANAVLATASALDRLHGATTRVRGGIASLSDVGGRGVGVLKQVAAVAAQAALVVAALGVGALAAGAKYIGGLQAFKQSTEFALERSLGSAKLAQDAWASASRMAILTGGDIREIGSAYGQLAARGFKLPEIEELVGYMSDLKTLNPTANIDRIVNAIAQIKAKGKLTQEELTGQLADTGLNVTDVYEQLQAKYGKDRATILKMISEGKISGEEGVEAIKNAIAKQTGRRPGELAGEAASKTMVGSLMRAKAVLDVFLASLKIDWSPVSRFATKVGNVLKSSSGVRFGKAIEGGFDAVLGILDSISEKDLSTGLDVMSGMLESAASGARDLAESVRTVDSWIAAVTDKTSTWGVIFSGIGGAVTAVGGYLVSVVLGPLYLVADVLEQIYDLITKVGSASSSLSIPAAAMPRSSLGMGGDTGPSGGGGFNGEAFLADLARFVGIQPETAPQDAFGRPVDAAAAPGATAAPVAQGAPPAAGGEAAAGPVTNIITVTANGLTFAGFEAKVAEIVQAELAKQED